MIKKILDEFLAIYQNILLYVMCWCGKQMFKEVDLYCPKQDRVEAVTFSNNKKFMKYISKFEEKK